MTVEELKAMTADPPMTAEQAAIIILQRVSPLLAQSGHFAAQFQCPLLEVKRTSAILLPMRHCAMVNGYVVCLSSCLNPGFAEAAGDIR
jgi:hypothetical protein